MKYLLLPFYALVLALLAYGCALLALSWMWGVFPLWHLRRPTRRDFPHAWVSRQMLLQQWPSELWQRATGRYRRKRAASLSYYYASR